MTNRTPTMVSRCSRSARAEAVQGVAAGVYRLNAQTFEGRLQGRRHHEARLHNHQPLWVALLPDGPDAHANRGDTGPVSAAGPSQGNWPIWHGQLHPGSWFSGSPSAAARARVSAGARARTLDRTTTGQAPETERGAVVKSLERLGHQVHLSAVEQPFPNKIEPQRGHEGIFRGAAHVSKQR